MTRFTTLPVASSTGKRADRDWGPQCAAVDGYRATKLVTTMPTSTVYAIPIIVAAMTILSIFAKIALNAARGAGEVDDKELPKGKPSKKDK